eukprot:PITA_28447
MAQSSSAAASTSASTSTAPNSDHDVFINHRGLDVKKNFASHLYRRLQSYGLRVFLDQPELQRGDYFAAQIEEAIRYASVHVAIFSSGYAESTWCLRELDLMLQSNSPVIPVFYKVKPEELRWTRGKEGGYAKALEGLEKKMSTDPQTGEEKLRYDPSLIQNWRNALSKAAGISGFELEACNGDEGELVDNVVEEVLKRVKKPVLHVAKYPRGLDDKVIDFENTVILPRQHAGKPQIVGIVGLGGVGKTTLAKELFNRKSSGYSRCCFLADVRDNADKGTLHVLQIELLKKLGWDKPVDNVHEAKTILKRHISSPNILIILDDVDKMDQVDELLPDQTVLHSDSLILITSRSKDVLRRSGVEESSMYNLNGLPPQYSLELFCLYSFNQPHPLPGFESLAKKFTEACGGLPLSLKVFGALLNGEEDASCWEAQLDRLQRILPEEIKQRLQISYDALHIEDRQIFLDIACFFIGEDRDRVIRIYAESGGNGLWGFRNLENKCLVEVNNENQIRMHDQLRDLGREIADDASLPRRLWLSPEKIDDLLQQSSEMNEVRGIRSTDDYSSVMPRCQRSSELFWHCFMKLCNNQYPFHGSGICLRNLQLLHCRGFLVKRILTKVRFPTLVWLRWDNCPYSSLHSSISYLKNLRVLQVEGRKLKTLWKKESQAPSKLRELEIKASLSSIPESIGKLTQLERIVIRPYLMYGKVNLTQLPEEFCSLQSLKVLVLDGFSEMKSLPECFGKLSSLHRMQLPGCSSLRSLPDSLGDLTSLHQIDLSGCSSLRSLPNSLGDLTSLHQIDLSKCFHLRSLPDSLGDLSSLHHINLSSCKALESLPDSLGDLSSLHHINLSSCKALKRLPDSFCKLIKLQHLNLRECTSLTMSSETLGNVSTLVHINLSGCSKIEVLPLQVVHQVSLRWLYLTRTNLKELPSAIGELHDLEVLEVGGLLDAELPPTLCSLKSLKKLGLYYCNELKCLPASLGDLRNLKELRIENCRKLNCLPASLGLLTQLTELTVKDCPLIREVPFLPLSDLESSIDHCILPRLQKLDLSRTGISEVSFAEGVCFKLRNLLMYYCYSLVEVGTLPNTLITLNLNGCHSLRKMDNIYGLAKLRELYIRDCIELEELPCIETLVSLRIFFASGCVKLKGFRGLGQLTKLEELDVGRCSELEEMEGIQHCMSLKWLRATECPKLQWDAGVVEQLRQRMGSAFGYGYRRGCLGQLPPRMATRHDCGRHRRRKYKLFWHSI